LRTRYDRFVAIAFFDLDRTLLDVNSASFWIKRELRLGYLTMQQALVAGWWVMKYQLGVAELSDVLYQAIAALEGVPEENIERRSRAMWDEDLAHRIRKGAVTTVGRHREAGDELVLLTSSSPYVSRPAVEALGLDDFLCNRFEVKDGVFTGKADGPLCYGAGKITHAEAYAKARGVELADCAFYTDSYSDLPMLEKVGTPVVVDPDPRLAREAKRRRWPIVDWDAP